MQLILATHNAHKTREFRELLGNQFQIGDLSGSSVAPVEETGKTFVENAVVKAVIASYDQPDALVIADDSGLEVSALGGAPGIFSARYTGPNATDPANIEKLLRELRGPKDRAARFQAVIALARGGQLLGTFQGTVEGSIVEPPRGEQGFGYDPIFQPNGFDQTFSEMAPALKNQISHRAKAAAALRDFLKQRLRNRED